MTSKVNTGTRSKAQDAEALAAVVDPNSLASNQKVVEKDGGTYIVTATSGGMTVSTRVA